MSTNRIGHLGDSSEPNNPFKANQNNSYGDAMNPEEPELPEGYDPRRLPPPEPSRMMPLEVGFPKADLLRLLDANMITLAENAPAVDAPLGSEGAAETLFMMEALKAMRRWVVQHPAESILIAMYPSSELEYSESDEEGEA